MSEQFDPYMLGGTQTEEQRLLAQALEFEIQSRWLLDQIDIRPGWRALDIGSGPIGILIEPNKSGKSARGLFKRARQLISDGEPATGNNPADRIGKIEVELFGPQRQARWNVTCQSRSATTGNENPHTSRRSKPPRHSLTK